jgi:hypothetical protein
MKRWLIPWLARALLTVLLLFASEVLLWANPPGRTFPEWMALGVGYLALAALLLDFMARFRIRDVFGLLALAGLYGLLASLLLNPATALADVPRTWATRVLGANTLLGLVALAAFLQLRTGANRRLLAGAGIAGVLWGLWVRWLAVFTDLVPSIVPLDSALLYAGALLLIAALIWLAIRRENAPASASMRLSLIEWALVLVTLIGLLLTHLSVIDTISLGVLLALAIYCGVVLWFEKRDGSQTLFDIGLPVTQSTPLVPAISAVIFLIAGAIGYSLPFTEATSPFGIMIAVFAAFGLVWLPTVSLVLGVRAYRQMGRQRQL